tara:strand:- start:1403 stop:1798 length:396 start_codon:yes stop_codon:yes gene_type:complete
MTLQSGAHFIPSYQTVERESRDLVSGPYFPVAILFEELGKALNLIIESAKSGEDARRLPYQANAQAILIDLGKELDFEAAGDLAQTLRILYSEAAKRIQLEGGASRIERIESAQEMIHEIKKTWTEMVKLN